ncbi:hypothetical protein GCM10020295_63470 [Streptomyces cinereospinus]
MSTCRTAATTADVTAPSVSARPAAVRPTRPLPRKDAYAAIARARSGGHPREQPQDLRREGLREAGVLRRPAPRVPGPAAPPGLRVRQAPLLGPREPRLLDEDALPLITAPAPVEPHDDRRQPALLARPARQRGVAPRQEDQVPQVGTVEAPRRPLHHDEQRQRPAPAPGAALLLR